MKTYRVLHQNMVQLNFPELCPHCLSDAAKSHIKIAKHHTMPGVVSLKYLEWPVCERCSDYNLKVKRKSGLRILSSFGLLILITGVVFYLMLTTNFISMSLAFSIPFVFILCCIVYSQVAKSRLAKSMGLPFAKPPITLHRTGKHAFGKGQLLEFSCHQAEYAKAYINANADNGTVTTRPKLKPTT